MKKALVLFLCISALGIGGLFWLFRNNTAPQPDTVALNDAVMTAMQSNDHAEATRLLSSELTRVYEEMDTARRTRDSRTLLTLCCLLGTFVVAGFWLALYCERSILSPFRRLQAFAQNVAAGNLDVPLTMDHHSRFGAFTESFDLMREELKRARENERKASQSKKELVASLSHDIKTPVASIKAVTELMMVKSPAQTRQCEIILAKADQIDLLITNMFHATLEELEQLKVQPKEIPSTVLYELLQSADYDNKAHITNIPECIVTADKARLQQVLDNIINNSYKYAGTEIEITSRFDGPYLTVEVSDAGPGVTPDDLPLIFEKFYRGGNAADKSGSGLGLYISKHLMGKMNGDIRCEQSSNRFTVKILLAM